MCLFRTLYRFLHYTNMRSIVVLCYIKYREIDTSDVFFIIVLFF